MKSTIKKITSSAWSGYLLLFIVSIFLLTVRGWPFLTACGLYAEDGRIFLMDALGDGWQAFFKPYAGYLHMLLRIAAALVAGVDATYAPELMIVVSYLLVAGSILCSYAVLHNFSFAARFIAALSPLLVFQLGSVWLNLCNSQWFIAMPLIFIVATPRLAETTVNGNGFRHGLVALGVLLAALTGPFSIFLLPVAMLRLLVMRDWRAARHVYLPLFAGAITQLVVVMQQAQSARLVKSDNNMEILARTPKIMRWLVEGVFPPAPFLTHIILGLLLFSLWQFFRNGKAGLSGKWHLVLLIIPALAVYLAGMWKSNFMPELCPMRYHVIPYAMYYTLFALTMTRRRVLCQVIGITLLFAGIAGTIQEPLYKPSFMPWQGFLKITGWTSQSNIPLFPPGWYFNAKVLPKKTPSEATVIDEIPDSWLVNFKKEPLPSGNIRLQLAGEHPYIRIPVARENMRYRYMGIILRFASQQAPVSTGIHIKRAGQDSLATFQQPKVIPQKAGGFIQYVVELNNDLQFVRLKIFDVPAGVELQSMRVCFYEPAKSLLPSAKIARKLRGAKPVYTLTSKEDLQKPHDIGEIEFKENAFILQATGSFPYFSLPVACERGNYAALIRAWGGDGHFQLFYRTSEQTGFNEKESKGFSVKYGRDVLVKLPKNIEIQELRLNTGNQPGEYVIEKFQVLRLK